MMIKRIGLLNVAWQGKSSFYNEPKTYIAKIESSDQCFTLRRMAVPDSPFGTVYHALWTSKRQFSWYIRAW